MIFSYNFLQSFFRRKLPKPDKLAELLIEHSFEVTEVKKVKGDFVLDIEVLPNRAADCFSHWGIAREIAVVTNSKFQIPNSKLIENKKLRAKDFVTVEVKDKKACPRYTARVMTGVKVGSSPAWLKDRLGACGLNSINNVVDIANYVMLETGQPLHAFDGEKLEENKIVVRFAKPREKIVTLDEQRFDLFQDVLVIADAKKPVAIAGIKGGKLPEIDKKTKTIVLESADFHNKVIRQGSKRLNLKTDASLRFEHGLSPDLTELAVNRACYLIQKVAGGKVVQGLIDVYPKKALIKRIKLDLDYLKRLLDIEIPSKEVKAILERLGFKVNVLSLKSLKVIVPKFRLDISVPEDLIEEVARIYGYDKITPRFPVASLIPAKRNEEIFWENMAKDILKEAGFTEVYNYSFIGSKEGKIFSSLRELIELENPISQEYQYLRPSLIPNLLKNVEKNIKYFSKIRIFEIGKIFNNSKDREKRQLTGLITSTDFYSLKGVIDLLLQKLGISSAWYDEYQATPEQSKFNLWHPKKCAEIKTDGQEIGFLGEISPRILQTLKISSRVVVFDLDFDKLQKLASEEHEFRPLSRYPSAVRDLAVLVPRVTRIVEVLNKVNVAGGNLVRDVDLFDMYEGEELPRGKKNLAFHIIYQSKEKTLTSKEVDGVHQKIIKALEKNPSWEVRR